MSRCLRTEVICIPITQNTWSFSVTKAVNKRDVHHHFCSVYSLSQRPSMVFLLPTFRYRPFDLWYEGVGQRNFASGNCVKEKWLLQQEQLFQTAIQSTLLTLQRLIQLPQIYFLRDAPHSTVNGYIQILVLWKVSSKKIFSKYSFWEGQQHESQNSCSSPIKNVLFSSFFE